MWNKSACILGVTVVSMTSSISAAALGGGAVYRIQTSEHESRRAVVALPAENILPDASYWVELSTGDKAPAQLDQREGQDVLVFIAPRLPAGQVVSATVREGAIESTTVSFRAASPTRMDVWVGEELVTTYHHDPAQKKPYCYPLHGPNGVPMTRGFPMETIAGEPQDHPHHRSLWVAYGDVNGVDCWSEGRGSGFQRPQSLEVADGPVFGRLRAVNHWLDNAENPVVREERILTFYNTPSDQRMIDVAVTFVAAFGEVRFGDTKEGGILALRVNPAMDDKGDGTLMNAAGLVGESDVWGKASPWVDNYGPIGGMTVGAAIFDTPGNLRYPTTWHARGYGLIAANCFGLSYFTHGKENGDYTLAAGESLTFRYRLILHAGSAAEARVAELYQDYIQPPSARR